VIAANNQVMGVESISEHPEGFVGVILVANIDDNGTTFIELMAIPRRFSSLARFVVNDYPNFPWDASCGWGGFKRGGNNRSANPRKQKHERASRLRGIAQLCESGKKR